jgi:hypothetical protein
VLGLGLKIDEKCYENSSVLRSVMFENCYFVPFASIIPFHSQAILCGAFIEKYLSIQAQITCNVFKLSLKDI